MTDAVPTLRKSLDEANAALAGGDAPEAERRAKAVSALVRAERDLAEFAAAGAHSNEDDDEEFCADLRRRLVAYAEADLADAPPDVLERIATEGLRR